MPNIDAANAALFSELTRELINAEEISSGIPPQRAQVYCVRAHTHRD